MVPKKEEKISKEVKQEKASIADGIFALIKLAMLIGGIGFTIWWIISAVNLL